MESRQSIHNVPVDSTPCNMNDFNIFSNDFKPYQAALNNCLLNNVILHASRFDDDFYSCSCNSHQPTGLEYVSFDDFSSSMATELIMCIMNDILDPDNLSTHFDVKKTEKGKLSIVNSIVMCITSKHVLDFENIRTHFLRCVYNECTQNCSIYAKHMGRNSTDIFQEICLLDSFSTVNVSVVNTAIQICANILHKSISLIEKQKSGKFCVNVISPSRRSHSLAFIPQEHEYEIILLKNGNHFDACIARPSPVTLLENEQLNLNESECHENVTDTDIGVEGLCKQICMPVTEVPCENVCMSEEISEGNNMCTRHDEYNLSLLSPVISASENNSQPTASICKEKLYSLSSTFGSSSNCNSEMKETYSLSNSSPSEKASAGGFLPSQSLLHNGKRIKEDTHNDVVEVGDRNSENTEPSSPLKAIVNFKRKHLKHFVFLHNNVNSLRHKFAHFQELLSKHNIDLLAISETKLSDSFPKSMFNVTGYDQFRQDLSERSGGLVVFVRDDLARRRLTELEINKNGFESVCIEISIGKQKTVFACVYKHPSVSHVTFKEQMCTLIDSLLLKSSDICILGDLNSCPRKSNVIKDLCDYYNLYNLINKPTCCKGKPTVIDVILVSNKRKYSGILNCESHVSDFHNWIGAATKRFAPTQKPSRIKYRSYKKFKENDYCFHVLSAPFHVGEIFNDIEDMAWFTNKLLSDIIEEHAPLKTKIIKKQSVPYMNACLRKAMYNRNMARNKYRKFGETFHENYRRQRNLVVKIRKQSLREYFSKNCSIKDKTFWNTISPFMSDKKSKTSNIILHENDQIITDKSQVCDIFNDYFVNIASSIGFDDNITSVETAITKHSSHPSIIKIKDRHPITNQFSFKPVSTKNIRDKLKSIDPKKATGFDNIPGKLLRIAHNELCVPLTYLINNCMKCNTFPDIMKYAELNPIYKKSDNLFKGNYRPVSILTTVSKLYELVINEQLADHVLPLLNSLLSAFRKGHSCQTLLVKCIEDWKSALAKNNFVGVLFMDLSKAFDCLPHSLLIAKLEAYGLDVASCHLIGNYLSNRKQRVKIGDSRSKWAILSKGVPQGSILGPLLFNIFINDLFFFIEKCNLYNYADDNFLSHVSKSSTEVLDALTLDGKISIKWFNENGMQANPDKFQFLAISSKTENDFQLSLSPDTVIKSEEHVNALGVIIDNKLNFTEHISAVCKKAARQLNALARISNYLDIKSRKIIYQSFVASNFNYCPLVWHFCGKVNNSKLEKIQERALKIIYKDYESTYNELITKSNSCTLLVSRLRILLCEVFKSIKKINTACLNDLFEIKVSDYSFRDELKLYQPLKKNTTYGLRSLTYTGAKLWNDQSLKINKETDLPMFKNYINDLHIKLDPLFDNYV